MDSIGEFGIGFFSAFMLGSHIRVITRRFDRSESEALLLEFQGGLRLRPILSEASAGIAPIDGGTRVEINLCHDPRIADGLNFRTRFQSETIIFRRATMSLTDHIARLAPASDVTIDAIAFGRSTHAVVAADWLKISAEALTRRALLPNQPTRLQLNMAKLAMRPLVTQNGRVVGRAALWPLDSHLHEIGGLISRGLRVRAIQHILGVLQGGVATAARNAGDLQIPREILSTWATEQASIIQKSKMSVEQKALCAELILSCEGNIFELPIVEWGGRWLGEAQLRDRVAKTNEITMHVGPVSYEDDDYVPKALFEQSFEPNTSIVFVPKLYYGIDSTWRNVSTTAAFVRKILKEEWGNYESDSDVRQVGKVEREEISRFIESFRRMQRTQ
jgi:hypothetical protein